MIRRRPALAAAALLILSGQPRRGAVMAQDAPLKVFGAYATADRGALGRRHPRGAPGRGGCRSHRVHFVDDLGYAGDMERTLRDDRRARPARHHLRRCLRQRGGRARRGRGLSATSPSSSAPAAGLPDENFSVFDNWIHEPAYLAGMLAGGLTKTGIIGVVGGVPVPEVNRITNAFIAGRPGRQPGGRGQGQLHQQLVRPGHRQGGCAGADRRRRGRPLRRARRRHRGGRRERPAGHRQHERPVGAGARQRRHQRHLEHDAHRRVRHRPGRRRHVHRAGPQGLQHGRPRAAPRWHPSTPTLVREVPRTSSRPSRPRRRTSSRASSAWTSTSRRRPGSVIPE